MKKIFMFLTFILLGIVLIACDDPVPPVEYEFELEAELAELEVGSTMFIYLDTDKSEPEVTWESENTAVATVVATTDTLGSVTGVSEGSVDIVVTIKDVGTKKITINVVEKLPSAKEVQTKLNELLDDYLLSKNGSIKVISSNGGVLTTSETIYNYSSSGELESIMYLLKNDNEFSIYVKDGFSYVNTNGEKIKRELTEIEEAMITDQYGHGEFLSLPTKFYSDDAFFNALGAGVKVDGRIEYKLNINNYTGNIINVSGADELLLLVDIAGGKITKVEIVKKSGNLSEGFVVEYRGHGSIVEIDYPNFDSYQ